MKSVLAQEKCIEVFNGEAIIPPRLTPTKKNEMVDKVRSVIIVCL